MMQRDEPATAEVAGFRIGDRQHEGRGDRRINCVTAVAQHGLGHLRAVAVGYRDGCGGAAQWRGQECGEQRVEEQGR